ncbi:MAG: hypothetical protein [Bacteriophage sp.]|nr:MAG: hypothetical protein [Bacteriophage sp.]
MFNFTEPLPELLKTKYYECYAKIVLEELYQEEFIDLKLEDKPDLQMENGQRGIEVVISEDKKNLEAESLYSKIECNKIRNKEKAIEKIEKLGNIYKDGILSSSSKVSFKFIFESFNDKIDKLNGGGYDDFAWNYLFIFSSIIADNRMIKEAIREMKQIQSSKERKFYKVLVLVPGYLYCLDLYNDCYEIKPIDSKIQFNQSGRARVLAESLIQH